MSKAYRSADEQELLSLRALERRIANLERASAGLVAIQSQATIAAALTTSFVNVAGTTITITRPGRYLLVFTFDFTWSVASAGNLAVGQIASTGHTTLGTTQALMQGDTIARLTLSNVVAATYPSTGTAVLQAAKTGAGGTSTVTNQHTQLTAIRTGPA